MKPFRFVALTAAVLLTTVVWVFHVRGQQPRYSDYVEGRLIIKLKHWVLPSQATAIRTSLNASVERRFSSIEAELWNIQGTTVEDAIDLYQGDPRVEYIEPDYIQRVVATIPGDPRFSELWGLHNTGQTGGTPDADIDAPEAWDIETGGDVLVGVIDTGVDWAHPDLAANIFTNPGEIPSNGIDDDGNGFIDDVRGWDFLNEDNNPTDDNGHGTHCAGTIAAVGNNGIGVVGVSWSARILPLKFLSSGGSGTTSDAIEAVEYATMMGVRLTSNSWGGGGFSSALESAIDAAGDAGIFFVAAAGNSASNNDVFPHYPSSYNLPNIISVAATDHNDQLAGFSSYGATSVDLAAPGVNILSTFPGNSYGAISGTSMATPHVSGAVSLVWSAAPSMPYLEVKDLILSSTDPRPALAGRMVSGGRLNVFNAISGLDSIPPSPVTDLAVVSTGSNTATLSWTATGDDGDVGTATLVDLRYSTSPIDAGNYNLATPVPGVPAPQPSGTAETYTVWGLDFNTLHYFALTVLDDPQNRSSLSNVVSGTTLGIPQVVVSPTSLADSLFTGGTASHTVTIKNVADGTLDFTLPGPLPVWVVVQPDSGRVFAGDSLALEFVFDATGLFGGNYAAAVAISTNDPGQPTVTINAQIHVTGAPDIALSNEAIDYEERFIGHDSHATLTVTNIGTDVLQVSQVTSDNPVFSVDTSVFTLPPSQSLDLVVTFHPTNVGPKTGTLSIDSDDPDQPRANVSLQGIGIVPPDIAVSPGALDESLLVGQTATATLVIDNTGGSDLSFTLEEGGAGLSINQVVVIPFGGAAAPDALAAVGPNHGAYSAGHAASRSPIQASGRGLIQGTASAAEGNLRILLLYMGDVSEIRNLLLTFSDIDVVDTFSGTPTLSQLLAYDATMVMVDTPFSNPAAVGDVLADYVDEGGGVVLTLASFISAFAVRGRFLDEGYSPFTLGSGPVGDANLGAFDAAHPIMDGVTTAYGDVLGSTTLAPGATWVADWDNGLPLVATKGDRVVGVNIFTAASGYWTGDVPLILHNAAAWSAIQGSCWLSMDATSGVVPANSSVMIEVTFDASSTFCVTGGEFFDTLRVVSNDPDESEVLVPVQLQVTDAPHTVLSVTSLDFRVFVGGTGVDALTITNEGSEVLSITDIAADKDDFGVDVTNFDLDPGESRDVLVAFAPSEVVSISGVLTISSNDPDGSIVTVPLSGAGLEPPVIRVAPAAFNESHFTGGTSTETMTISNTGGNNLVWTARIMAQDSTTQVFTLTVPDVDSAETVDGAPAPEDVRTTAITALLADLTDVDILWDRSHGQSSSLSWSTIVSDLTARGATVTESLSPITSPLLEEYEMIWLTEMFPWSTAEIAALAGWVRAGGSVLFETDNSWTAVNALLSAMGTGIVQSTVPVSPGTTTNIYPHETTEDVSSLNANSGPLASLSTVVAPAGRLADDENGQGMVAYSEVQGGRVVVLCDELFHDFTIGLDDNQLFGNQVVDWLAGGVRWLSVEPKSGTVAPGSSQALPVTYDAARLRGGDYYAAFEITNNDPLAPVAMVPAHLDVTGAPDIVLSDAMLDYGQVFVGASPKDTLVVSNDGTDILVVSNVSTDNGDYTVDVTSFDLDPGESQGVLVTFAPSTTGMKVGTLTITSNDPDEATVTVALTGEGLEPPVISVSPASLSDSLFSGGRSTQVLTLDNTAGGNALLFDISIEGLEGAAVTMRSSLRQTRDSGQVLYDGGDQPNRALAAGGPADVTGRNPATDLRFAISNPSHVSATPGAGDVIRVIPAPGNVLGLTWLNKRLWAVVADSPQRIVEIDPDDGTVLSGFSIGSDYHVGLASDGSNLWVCNFLSGTIEAYTPGGSLVTTWPAPMGPSVRGIAWDGEALWIGGANWGTLYRTDTSGNVLETRTLSYDVVSWAMDMEWIDGHSDGPLWIVDNDLNNDLNQFDPTIEPPVLIQDFAHPDPGNGPEGVAHDGENMWLSAFYASVIYLVDDGIAELHWLSADPTSGSVAPGHAMDIQITFDAFGLFGGDYDAEIVITNNDPLTPVVTVPAHLDVTGAPDIALSDSMLNYGQVFVGASPKDTLVVSNDGTDILVVSNVSTDNGDYTVDVTSFDLNPEESRGIVVTFAPSTTGMRVGTLTITSDDPDEATVTVALTGLGLEPPVIGVAPSSFSESLLTGETSTETMTISNTGGNNLVWSARVMTQDSTTQVFTLTVPDADSTETMDIEPAPQDVRTTAITALLEDLTDVDILWDRSHAQFSVLNWSTIVSDLTARGATVTENFSPITPQLLEDYEMVWSTDMFSSWTGAEIAALAGWVEAGGGVLFETDESATILNALLSAMGAGIVQTSVPVLSGPTTNIYPHETTEGVSSLSAGGPLASLSTVVAPAGHLVDDMNDVGMGAYSEVQRGRVVVVCDEIFVDGVIGGADNQLFANQVVDWLVVGVRWLSVDPTSGTVAPGFSQAVAVTFDATRLVGGDYHAAIEVTNNDPLSLVLMVPAHLDVTGAPDIALSDSTVDFGTVFLGAQPKDTLVISNVGTDVLVVSDVSTDNGDYTVDVSSFSVDIGESRDVVVTFAPSATGPREGTLSITSDDPDESVLEVSLLGYGLLAPAISVSPDSLSDSLVTGGTATHALTISNSGGSDLVWSVATSVLNSAAEDLGQRMAENAASSPTLGSPPPGNENPSAPPEVVAGIYTGAHLSFGISIYGELIPFQHPVGAEHLDLGSRISGYTVAYRVGGSDNLAVASFELRTNLAAVSYTETENSASRVVVNVVVRTLDNRLRIRRTFTFLKDDRYVRVESRLENTSGGSLDDVVYKEYADWDVDSNFENNWDYDLSRNMTYAWQDRYCTIAAAEAPTVMDIYGWNDYNGRQTFVDFPTGPVLGFDGMEILHFGLGNLSSSTQRSITTAFASGNSLTELREVVERGIMPWLRVNPLAGVVLPGSSQSVSVTFDAAGLVGGDYRADIAIANNDPLLPIVTVPAHLDVTGAPDIALSDTTLDYGLVFVGATSEDTLVVLNAGTDVLVVSDVSTDNTDYTVDVTSFSLNPLESRGVVVSFAPSVPGTHAGTLSVTSEDPDEPVLDVGLSGQAAFAPVISVTPDSLSDTLATNETATHTLAISNLGAGDLSWSVAASIIEVGGEDLGQRMAENAAGPPPSGTVPPGNEEGGTPPPDILAGMYVGTHLRFGITDYAELMPFQQPLGNEHLQIGTSRISGFTVAYRVAGSDNIGRASFFSRVNIAPVSYTEIENSASRVVVEVVVRTLDNRLQIRRTFVFPTNDRFVRIETRLENTSGGSLDDVVYKEYADWDVDGSTSNNWDYDLSRNMAYAWQTRYCTIAGVQAPTYMDVFGWDDYIGRATFVNYPTGPISALDGLEILHFDLGDVSSGEHVSRSTVYASGNGLAQLRAVVDRALVPWLRVSPLAGVVPPSSSRNVSVTIDATGLFLGDYRADIRVTSNDPATPTVTVPVFLAVDSTTVVTTGVDPDPIGKPARYALHSNFPNPFNPTTTIQYEVAEATDVRLEIYSIRGERVAVLVDRHQPTGRYSVPWDGRSSSGESVASGVYLYRLRAGEFVQTRKMQLLK